MTTKSKPQRASKDAPSNSWSRLTSRDLTGFDQRAKELILNAMELGCTGKISSRHHAILRNAAGGTTSVPRNLTSQNRTSKNCEAGVRRLLEQHTAATPATEAAAGDNHAQGPSTITVKEAFLEHGAAFSSWLDTLGHSLPADALIEVRTSARGAAFDIADQPTPGTGTTLQAAEFHRDICDDTFEAARALGNHRRTHGTRAVTLAAIATANNVAPKTVRNRLQRIGAVLENGDLDITPENLQKAGLVMPPTNTASPASTAAAQDGPPVDNPGTDLADEPPEPTEPVPTPRQPEDAALVLERIRHALGEDPRIAVLTARVHELEQLTDQLRNDLAREKTRADEAVARTEIIRDALDL